MSLVNEEKSWFEWLVFGLSLILILGVVSYLIYDIIEDSGRPPDIKVTLGQPVTSPHGAVVPVTATNAGDKTAQAVEVEVTAGSESATLGFDFLSSGEVRKGWAGFTSMPSGQLTVRVVGYRSD